MISNFASETEKVTISADEESEILLKKASSSKRSTILNLIRKRVYPTRLSFRVNPVYAQMSEIVDGLFISGISGLRTTKIHEKGITHIINATSEVPNLKALGNIERTKLWLENTPQTYIYPHLELLSDQIEAIIHDGGKVLVHCVCGTSRSPTIGLAFLTKHRCRTLRDAYCLMSRKHPIVQPNIGFWKQLITFEKAVKRSPPSVHLVRDLSQASKLLPDVYLPNTMPSFLQGNEDKERKIFSRTNSDSRFTPVLEPLQESLEASI